MDWYKHSTGSHDDPDISDAMDEFGHAGYSVFFICLEIYGQEYNHLDEDGWLTLSKRFLSRKLRLSQNKVEDILYFYSERGRIIIKTSTKVEQKLNKTSTEVEQNLNFRLKSQKTTKENIKNTISLKCTKFIDIASNWTKRKVYQPTEGLQRTASVPTAKEEEEKKNRIEEDINNLNVDEKKPVKKERKKSESIIRFDADQKRFVNIPDEIKKRWGEVAPGIKIDDEIGRAELWVISNPDKHRSQWTSFLSSWMVRAQKSYIKYGGGNGSNRQNDTRGQREAIGKTQGDGAPYPVDAICTE